MIVTGTLQPYAGDQAKPGAWTPEEIAEWDRVASCSAEGHPPFWLAGARPWDDTCPGCGAVIRSRTDRDGLADHWAEQRADERRYQLADLEDREAAR